MITTPSFVMNSGNDPTYEKLLDELIQEVFGFSFQSWFDVQVWDDRYESYSIIENGKMLANLCIYRTELMISGKPLHAHQFGAVAVHPSHRGKGYVRSLLNEVRRIYPGVPAFLSANESVREFYPKLGFRRISVHRPIIEERVDHPITGAKVSPADPDLWKALKERNQHSNEFASLNSMPIEIFHLIMDYSENIYFLPEADIYLVAEQKGMKLFIADIIASHPIDFQSLKPHLPFTGVEHVEFGFSPDHLGIEATWLPAGQDSLWFIHGDWDLPDHFCFPVMSIT